MQDKTWFVPQSPGRASCQAQVFRVRKARFLHIGFQKDPTAKELQWANGLLRQPRIEGPARHRLDP